MWPSFKLCENSLGVTLVFCYLNTVALILAHISMNNNLKLKPSNGLHPLLQIRWHFTFHKTKYPIAYGGMCTPPSETSTVITPSQKTIDALPHEMTSIRIDRSISLWAMNVLLEYIDLMYGVTAHATGTFSAPSSSSTRGVRHVLPRFKIRRILPKIWDSKTDLGI